MIEWFVKDTRISDDENGAQETLNRLSREGWDVVSTNVVFTAWPAEYGGDADVLVVIVAKREVKE